ncbi:DUF3048 domain-containing protein [Hydrogenibacillus sp. N12]|uniref:DUF3048 domain-containing protein n=1 Tax=Hydrogenibacillus sp. N12 TaxID=2866627 RepID=UPI001C7CB79A|nr:DUF3048 domain-containing protein [Hydrogenibacillus sp. N12]QZA33301.1 DUF3048 domain-containing protein [Hydrogenibacillus sp. N12]
MLAERHRSIRRLVRTLSLGALSLIVLLAGCRSRPASEPEAPPADGPAVQAPAPEEKGGDAAVGKPYVSPLTGLPTDAAPGRRAIVAIIENSPEARPQSGLDRADVVYELLAEGGIPRFAAVYQTADAGTIGPIRSIRPYFIRLADGFDAVMVHAGGSPEALKTIADRGLPSLNGLLGEADPYFWRASFRKAPHNLYTSLENVRAMMDKKHYRDTGTVPGFRFLVDPWSGPGRPVGSPADELLVRYNPSYRVTYTYDAESRTYRRAINGQPHSDLETGKPLTATNILVLFARHRVLDSAGRLAIDLDGGGRGVFVSLGRAVPVTWENVRGVLRAYTEDRAEIAFAPGQTWVEVVPDVGATVQYRGAGEAPDGGAPADGGGAASRP